MNVDGGDERPTYHGQRRQKGRGTDRRAVGALYGLGYAVDPLDSGCCGMAGDSGYEVERYEGSRAVASPLEVQLAASDGATVVAPGPSRRTSIGAFEE